MNAPEVIQRFIDAFNRHDADAVNALYAEGATYHTPRFGHPLTGKAIGDFAKSVWAAFPDMSLEIITRGDTGRGLVAIQWVLHGTHNGPLMDGTPATGRTVAYPGAPSLRLRAIRFARSTHTLTGRRWQSNWGSKPSKPKHRLTSSPER
jgi:steroid delta-isomerase-like uncharacterized protein